MLDLLISKVECFLRALTVDRENKKFTNQIDLNSKRLQALVSLLLFQPHIFVYVKASSLWESYAKKQQKAVLSRKISVDRK